MSCFLPRKSPNIFPPPPPPPPPSGSANSVGLNRRAAFGGRRRSLRKRAFHWKPSVTSIHLRLYPLLRPRRGTARGESNKQATIEAPTVKLTACQISTTFRRRRRGRRRRRTRRRRKEREGETTSLTLNPFSGLFFVSRRQSIPFISREQHGELTRLGRWRRTRIQTRRLI